MICDSSKGEQMVKVEGEQKYEVEGEQKLLKKMCLNYCGYVAD